MKANKQLESSNIVDRWLSGQRVNKGRGRGEGEGEESEECEESEGQGKTRCCP